MAKQTGLFTELLQLAFELPWPIGVLVAVISWAVLHFMAALIPVPATNANPADMSALVINQFGHTVLSLLQFIVPGAFLIGAVAAFLKQSLREFRYVRYVKATDTPRETVRHMSWQEFEELIGEMFRRDGFQVVEKGVALPDGGVDLVLRKAGNRYLVQCKHWNRRNVGVNVVRELKGVVAAQGAAGGISDQRGFYPRSARVRDVVWNQAD